MFYYQFPIPLSKWKEMVANWAEATPGVFTSRHGRHDRGTTQGNTVHSSSDQPRATGQIEDLIKTQTVCLSLVLLLVNPKFKMTYCYCYLQRYLIRFFLIRTEHGSLARRDKISSTHNKSNHEVHNQGSLRSSSSTLSAHRANHEKHGRYAPPLVLVKDFLYINSLKLLPIMIGDTLNTA